MKSDAVSYTHLDVYKRQLHARPATRLRFVRNARRNSDRLGTVSARAAGRFSKKRTNGVFSVPIVFLIRLPGRKYISSGPIKTFSGIFLLISSFAAIRRPGILWARCSRDPCRTASATPRIFLFPCPFHGNDFRKEASTRFWNWPGP